MSMVPDARGSRVIALFDFKWGLLLFVFSRVGFPLGTHSVPQTCASLVIFRGLIIHLLSNHDHLLKDGPAFTHAAPEGLQTSQSQMFVSLFLS